MLLIRPRRGLQVYRVALFGSRYAADQLASPSEFPRKLCEADLARDGGPYEAFFVWKRNRGAGHDRGIRSVFIQLADRGEKKSTSFAEDIDTRNCLRIRRAASDIVRCQSGLRDCPGVRPDWLTGRQG